MSAMATAPTTYFTVLLDQAKGGTRHTLTSVPRWDGLWVTAGNTHMDMFIDPPGSGFKGKVRPGVLTPPYEAAYKERWRQQTELGEVQYDRLTDCQPVGYPRWLLEPYSHEFVNLPQESYLINDYGPGIRRVYTFENAEAWRDGAAEALTGEGPVVICLKIEGRLGQKTPKAPRPMPEQIARLRQALSEKSP